MKSKQVDDSALSKELRKINDTQNTISSENLKQINEIQKRIALIESKGQENAFFLPTQLRPELRGYFDELVGELNKFKLPKDSEAGLRILEEQKRLHKLKRISNGHESFSQERYPLVRS